MSGPTKVNTRGEPGALVTAQCVNKWLTIWRYAHGFLSFEGCNAAFRAHPEWRAE